MRRRVAGRIEPSQCGVWPENLQAVEIFLRCETQWRVSMAGITGLDYTAVSTVLELLQVEDRADCFDRLQVIEGAALAAIAKAEH